MINATTVSSYKNVKGNQVQSVDIIFTQPMMKNIVFDMISYIIINSKNITQHKSPFSQNQKTKDTHSFMLLVKKNCLMKHHLNSYNSTNLYYVYQQTSMQYQQLKVQLLLQQLG